jgi:uncharacterized protein
MSDPKAQNEPTMEEILASIRRIISENDEEQEAKKRSETQPTPPSPPPVIPTASAPAPAGAAVLELTEMVTEDGSVVSLTGEDELKEAREFLQSVASAPEPKPEPEPIKPMPEPEIFAESENERGTGGIVEPRDENAGKAGIEMANPKDDSVEFAPNGSAEKLVSEAAAAATTATFAELARSMAQEPTSSGNMALGSGRTLEDLVKEMLRPMLKDWLDQNLPPMVEHMVRRELDRMTRKAEGV